VGSDSLYGFERGDWACLFIDEEENLAILGTEKTTGFSTIVKLLSIGI